MKIELLCPFSGNTTPSAECLVIPAYEDALTELSAADS
jgi:hypothetical protein